MIRALPSQRRRAARERSRAVVARSWRDRRRLTAATVACCLLVLAPIPGGSLQAGGTTPQLGGSRPSAPAGTGVAGVAAAPVHAVPDIETMLPRPGSTVYYVSSTGRDSNDGLAASSAFRTIQKAVDLVDPGDSVLILPGIYTATGRGSDVVTITRSGTPDNWITLRNYPGTRPVIFNEASWQGINILGASYIVIEGLEVRGNGPAISRALASSADRKDPATNGNCIMAHKSSTGNPHHLVIRNNIVSGCPGGGIGTNYADYVTISDNVVHDTSWWSKWGTSGISVYESRDSDNRTGYRNFVINNLVYGNEQRLETYDRDAITDGNGIIIDDLSNSQTTGIAYSGRTLVQNNVSYRNGGRGIHVYRSAHVDVINNTTFWNGRVIEDDGEISVVSSHDVRVTNNISYAQPERYASYQYRSEVVYTNNIFYNGPVAGDETRHMAKDPRFVNASAGDFRLRLESPAIDSADHRFAPPNDIGGVIRPQGEGPDLGAYEASQ
jgi:hypothetical protein